MLNAVGRYPSSIPFSPNPAAPPGATTVPAVRPVPRHARQAADRPAFVFDRRALADLRLADQILFEHFGQGPRVEPAFSLLHRAFEAHAARQPDAVAVEHLGQSMTYGELERQANRLAARLAAHGVRPGDNVGLFLQRSIPMIVGIVATLKAGAAYVPQHVGVAPEAHLRHVAQVSETRVILTLSRLRPQVPVPAGFACLAVDDVMAEPFDAAIDYSRPFAPEAPLSPDRRCFIIFTSGTTGTPNGVQVSHRNVANILLTAPGDLGIGPGVKVAQLLSIAFDMAAWEILGTLTNGGTLIIRGKDFMPAARRADVIIATPSVLGTLDVDQCRHVKVVAVAGEPCPRPLAEAWSAFCTFYNACGPTETTIINTAQHFTPERERLTIGPPTPNNTVYVLDENRRPCKIGEIGEMWAGGDCVTLGYVGNPTLTDERYAPDPFLGEGRMMFRTRDLGRWTPDGELEHFGRTDDQVKVRGFRVELDSVSGVLEATPGCRQAVTLKLDNRNLVAFVQPATVDVDAARARVAAELPYYCTPAFVLALPQLPMTSRGKVDKRALLRLARAHAAGLSADGHAATTEATPAPSAANRTPVMPAVAVTS